MSTPGDPFKYTNPALSTPSTPPATRPAAERPMWQQAAAVIGGFVVGLYVLEFIDMLVKGSLDNGGIQPRTVDGLWGIVFAPVLHGGWAHLVANTIPLLVLGFLVMLSGIGRGLAATGIIWVIGGVGVWLFGSVNNHLGASVLVFGWLTYLITRGIFARHFGQMALGLVVLVIYGGALWGVLPGQPGISWEGHLFGAIGGVVAAWVLASDVRKAREAKALNR
ncbi:rhomboid family intramembrane serine protease [Rhodococcus maanshanensis]|uniref:Membrane associated serine protease, rhomboid family n=2 Tax=Rhodococcus TaxID=1827 RepID=A0A1H7WYG6_9NOCA|nr:Membrane associated serine protease, rhomboid family [Rhodococcus maanshanensis]